jgi:hypothetical protein
MVYEQWHGAVENLECSENRSTTKIAANFSMIGNEVQSTKSPDGLGRVRQVSGVQVCATEQSP